MIGKRIFVVDDEQKIRELIASYLKKEGYEVETFDDGRYAFERFRINSPDMLIIDIMMPEMDGYSLLREIRKTSEVPVIMVSAKGDEIDRVLGLELGSDDYISKPFSPRELVARVKNIFRRVSPAKEEQKREIETIKCSDIVIILQERRVLKDNIEIDLTAKEYDFMLHMVKNRNIVFTREQLLNSIWGYDFIGDTRAVDDLVKRIRKKLAAAGSDLEIVTVWGYGYKISDKDD